MKVRRSLAVIVALHNLFERQVQRFNFLISKPAKQLGKTLTPEKHAEFREEFFRAKTLIQQSPQEAIRDEGVQKIAKSWEIMYMDWITGHSDDFKRLEETICQYDLAIQVAMLEREVVVNDPLETEAYRMVNKVLNIIPRKIQQNFLVFLVNDADGDAAILCGRFIYLDHHFARTSSSLVFKSAIAHKISRSQTHVLFGFSAISTFNVNCFGYGDPDINWLLQNRLKRSIEDDGDAGAVILLCELEGSVSGLVEFISTHDRKSASGAGVETRIERIRDMALETRGCHPEGGKESSEMSKMRKELFG